VKQCESYAQPKKHGTSGFLPAFKNAYFDVFTTGNCRKAFKAVGLVPANAQVVLDCLEVQLRTLPEPLFLETP
jgi:hypothetical protein